MSLLQAEPQLPGAAVFRALHRQQKDGAPVAWRGHPPANAGFGAVFEGKNRGKKWENHRKMWENVGKPWENVGNPLGKPWENHGKMWETMTFDDFRHFAKGKGKIYGKRGDHGIRVFQ